MTLPVLPPLRLKAADIEDVAVISACLQDAILPVADAEWLAEERSFVMAINRFRWEAPRDAAPSRIHAGLRIAGVRSIQSKGFDRRQRDLLLSLLALDWAPDSQAADGTGTLTLIGAADRSLRFQVERLLVTLEDFGEPWPAASRPTHSVVRDSEQGDGR
ncbi:MAG: DUF2948 family protein [Alphaproteobacteria bacterium]|nr:DUF2948 family protein [Alphaproteobacteria bacterium]